MLRDEDNKYCVDCDAKGNLFDRQALLTKNNYERYVQNKNKIVYRTWNIVCVCDTSANERETETRYAI